MGKVTKAGKPQAAAAPAASAFSEEVKRAALEAERKELEAKLAAAKNSKERKLIKFEARKQQIEQERAAKAAGSTLNTTSAMLGALSELENAAEAKPGASTSSTSAKPKGNAAVIQQFAALASDPAFKGKGAFSLLQQHLKKTIATS